MLIPEQEKESSESDVPAILTENLKVKEAGQTFLLTSSAELPKQVHNRRRSSLKREFRNVPALLELSSFKVDL